MDEIESTSLSGNPSHAKYETEVLPKDVFLCRLTMLRGVSAVSVSWWLTLGCLQRFVRGLYLALWPNRGNQGLRLGSCRPQSRTTGLAVSRRGHSCLPEPAGTGQGAASS